MNSRIELTKLKPEPTFEKTILEIKYNHLNSITSTTMNLSDIPLFGDNFKHLSINSSIKVAKLKPEPTFEKTINEIKYNHMKSITSTATNLSAITLFDDNPEQLIMNRIIEVAKLKI